MKRLTTWIAVGVLAGCGGDDSTITGGDSGSSTSGDDESSSDGSDVSAESSGGGPESSSSASGVDTSGGATGESSSGGGPICGDGVMDEGEECDDENMVDGDACSAQCTVPFEVLWTMTHDGTASNQDFANRVIIDGDGLVYVVGSTRNLATGEDAWVQQYEVDGTEGWSFEFDGGVEGDDSASSLAFDGDGNLVVVGRTETPDTGEDILVLVVDPATQTLVGEPILVDGPGLPGPDMNADLDSADDVAIAANGHPVVAGRVRVDGQSFDIWVGEIDPAAMSPVVWEQSRNGPDSGPDSAAGVEIADDGTVYVLARQELPGNITGGLVLVYGADGTPQDADTVELDWITGDFELAADGNVVIVGSDIPGNSGFDGRISHYDSALVEDWTAQHDGPSHGNDSANGVAVDAMGRVVAVGDHSNTGQSRDGWIGTYQANGDPWWGDAYSSDSELDDVFVDVAVAPDGDYVVVGYETVLGMQRNAFVRKYHPL